MHRWEVAFEQLWPGDLPFETEDHEDEEFIRRAHVFPNGDLLGIFEYRGIFKLDKDSKVLWKSLTRNHHDFDIASDGSIVTLVRQHVTSDVMARK